MSSVRSMMVEVIAFYTNKENKFRRATGLSREAFKETIGDIVLNAEKNYRNNKITGFKNLDGTMKALKGLESVKDEYLKASTVGHLVNNYVESFFDPNNPKNKKIKKDLENPNETMQQFKKDSLITINFLGEYVKGILGENTPDAVLNIILGHVIADEPLPSNLDDITKKAIKKMKTVTEDE